MKKPELKVNRYYCISLEINGIILITFKEKQMRQTYTAIIQQSDG